VKVLAAIQSPKGQVVNSLLSAGLDILGILGIPVAGSMSLAKDTVEFIVRLLSGNGIDKANVFAIAHDLGGFIPWYS